MQYTPLAAAALCEQKAVLSCQTLLTWALGLLQADLGASALALALYSGSFLPFSPFTTVPAPIRVMCSHPTEVPIACTVALQSACRS